MLKKVLIPIIVGATAAVAAVTTTVVVLCVNNSGNSNQTTEPTTQTTTQSTTPTSSTIPSSEPSSYTSSLLPSSTPSSTAVTPSTTESTGPISNEGYRLIKVRATSGTVKVSDEYEEFDAYPGMNLYDGDKVVTSADSSMTIKLDNDKYLYLYENTTIRLKSEGVKSTKTNIYVENGKVLAEIEEKLGEDEEFYLSSSNSVMAVRGTTFGIDVTKDDNNTHVTYSVYKGITELFVFDNTGAAMIMGKLSNLSNAKLDVVIPNEDAMSFDSMKDKTDEWIDDCNKQYENVDDANETMEEVQIAVTKPTAEDYYDVTEKIDSSVSYSLIDYEAIGYIGEYDGKAHKIAVTPKVENATVFYSLEENGTYTTDNSFEYKTPGEYRVYFRIEADGYAAKSDYSVIKITKADLNVTKLKELTLSAAVVDTPLEDVLSSINLADYYSITGAESDNELILGYTVSTTASILVGTNEYTLNIVLPEEISQYYNATTIKLSATGISPVFNGTSTISKNTNNQYILSLNSTTEFIDENTISLASAFDGISFINSGTTDSITPSSIEYYMNEEKLNTLTLASGEYSVIAHATFDGIEYNLPIAFKYTESRARLSLSLEEKGEAVLSQGNIYIYNAGESAITNAKLIEDFGITVYDDSKNKVTPNILFTVNTVEYAANESVIIPTNQPSKLIINVPGSFENYSVSKTIYIAPGESYLPTWTIGRTLYETSELPVNFTVTVSDENSVSYSLDNKSFTDSITFTEAGVYKVYYKISDNSYTSSTGSIDTVYEVEVEIRNANVSAFNYFPTTVHITDQSIQNEAAVLAFIESYVLENGTFKNDITKEVLTNVTASAEKLSDYKYQVTLNATGDINPTVLPIIEFNYIPANEASSLEICYPREIVVPASTESYSTIPMKFSRDGGAYESVETFTCLENIKYWSSVEASVSSTTSFLSYGYYYYGDNQVMIFSSQKIVFLDSDNELAEISTSMSNKVDGDTSSPYTITINDYITESGSSEATNIYANATELAEKIYIIDKSSGNKADSMLYFNGIPADSTIYKLNLSLIEANEITVTYYGNSELGYAMCTKTYSIEINCAKRISIENIGDKSVDFNTDISTLEDQFELLLETYVVDSITKNEVDFEIISKKYVDEFGNETDNTIVTQEKNVYVMLTVKATTEGYEGLTATTVIKFYGYNESMM